MRLDASPAGAAFHPMGMPPLGPPTTPRHRGRAVDDGPVRGPQRTLSRRKETGIAPQRTDFHGNGRSTSGAVPHIGIPGSIEVNPKIDVTTTEKHADIGSRPPHHLDAGRAVVRIQTHGPSSSGKVVDSRSHKARSRNARRCAAKLSTNHTPTAATTPARTAISAMLPDFNG